MHMSIHQLVCLTKTFFEKGYWLCIVWFRQWETCNCPGCITLVIPGSCESDGFENSTEFTIGVACVDWTVTFTVVWSPDALGIVTVEICSCDSALTVTDSKRDGLTGRETIGVVVDASGIVCVTWGLVASAKMCQFGWSSLKFYFVYPLFWE